MACTNAICVLLFISSITFAEKGHIPSVALHKNTSPAYAQVYGLTHRDSVRILAIMVEFQTDANDQTTGDGTFLTQSSSTQIDPPPHDSIYFKNKLLFVENYFHKVSNGKLTITGDVYGQSKRIVLSKHISDYSPSTNTNDNKKLAELAEESWQKADTLYPEIDFSSYDAFVIFHAGAGRDIDLVSSLGYDPTPFDIPSLYLDSTGFAAALGSFSGIPVDGNTVLIKNSIFLPETESRVISTDFGPDTLQFSINGMFAGSIGSFLGLPDLFDTKTGRSAIGQFGLMDVWGIFAYNGLFPPEPSAWEKIALGWVSPILITNSSQNISVSAVGLTKIGQDTIYKIPINQSEYFLIENRNRDPEKNGQRLLIANSSGGTSWRYFGTDTVGFSYDDVSAIHGSVIDVEDFDWAVIGYSDATEKYTGGGILIWHIDESVIRARLSSNSVNADPAHRGIDLEEADGSQDIGQTYNMLASGAGTENGSALDCWFDGNSSPVYKNIFDGNSFPNSNSNSGAATLITIKDFSSRAPKMTMTVEFGTQVLHQDPVLYNKFTAADAFPASTGKHLYLSTNDGIYIFQSNGKSLVKDSTGLVVGMVGINGVTVNDSSTGEVIAGVRDNTISICELTSLNGQGSFDSVYIHKIYIGSQFTTSPCFFQDNILAGTDSGIVYQFDVNVNGNVDTLKRYVGSGSISSFTQLPNEYYCTIKNRIYGYHSTADLPNSSNNWLLAAAVSPKGDYITAAEENGNKVASFDKSLSKLFETTVPGSAIRGLAVADIDGDGEKEVIIQTATHLSVLNRIGMLLDGFPVEAKGSGEFTGTPLIVDFNGDGKPEIIVLTNDGEMWIYNQSGKLLDGFPVQVASPGKAFPIVYTNSFNKLGIAILSENGSFNAFLTSTSIVSTSLAWRQYLGDEQHRNADWNQTVINPTIKEFLPKSRVYNWPNPVYTHSTQIRYYTSEDANITITIIDISGMKITELKGRGVGGMDNEISWDVSNIQSGVYIARLEANSSTHNDVALIKIAVVK